MHTPKFTKSCGDCGLAVDAGLYPAHGCGINADGNLFMADTDNHRVRMVGP